MIRFVEDIYADFLYDCYVANQCLTEEEWLYYGREEHHIEVPARDGGSLTPLNSQYLTTYQHWVAGVLQSEVLQKWCGAFIPKDTLPSFLEDLRKKWAHNGSPGAKKGGKSTYTRGVGLFTQTREQLREAQRKSDKRKAIILIHPCGKEEFFASVTDAAVAYGLSRPKICAVMKGKRNHHRGFTARYAN